MLSNKDACLMMIIFIAMTTFLVGAVNVNASIETPLKQLIIEKNDIVLGGDTNNDFSVDKIDLIEIGKNYGTTSPADENIGGDVDGNGVVDIYDLSTVGVNYGETLFNMNAEGGSATLYVEPASSRAEPGEDVYVSVKIDTPENIFAVSLAVDYDETLINATNVEEGSFLSGDGGKTFDIISVDWDNGIISYDSTRYDTETGISGTGDLITIHFRLLNEGISGVDITDYVLIDENLETLTDVTAVDGSVQVEINEPAYINPIPDKNVNEGQTLTFTVTANDPEDDDFNLSVISGPGSMTDNQYSYTPGWDTNHNNEVYNVVIESEDEYGATDMEDFQLTVIDVNRDPTINPISDRNVNEGQTLSFTVYGSDPEGDTLSYAVISGPGSMAGNTYSYTPGWDTNHDDEISTVVIEARDGHGGSDTEDFQLTVIDVNRDPTINPISDRNVNEGQTLSFTVSGSDPDPDTLTYNVISGLGSMAGNQYTYITSWDTNHNNEVSTIVIEANDGHGGTDTEDFQLTVIDVNRAPSIDSYSPTDTTPEVDEGSDIMFTVTCSDPEIDTLQYLWTVDGSPYPSGLPSYTYSPTYAESGTHEVTVTPYDGFDNGPTQVWIVTVNDVPISCTQNSDCGTDGYVGSTFCSDDVVMRTYRTYTCNNPGTPSASCSYSDTNIAQETCPYKCVAGSCVSNQPPTINTYSPSGSPVSINEGESQEFSVTASDPYGDPLTYSWRLDGSPAGSGTSYTYNSDYSSAGTYTVLANVSDGVYFVTRSWQLIVNNVNRAPVINSYSPTNPTPSVDEGQTLAFSVTASDPDGDPLSYQWKLDGLQVSTSSSYTYSPDFDDSGPHTVYVKVSDASLYAEMSWYVTVNDVQVSCTKDSDCGIDGYIEGPSCSGLDLKGTYRTWTCNNPGTPSSSCSYTDDERTVETCSYLCQSGICIPNDDPVIAPIPDKNVNEGQTLTFIVQVTDTYGDTPSLSVKSGPGSLSGNTYSYTSSWDTNHNNETSTVVIEATDGHGGSDTEDFQLIVIDINRAPEFIRYKPEDSTPSLSEGSEMDFILFAVDPEYDTVSYEWTLDGVAVSPEVYDYSTGSVYNYNPGYSDSGTHKIISTASDGSASISKTWTVTVINVGTVSIPLTSGWNIVQLPARPVDTAITSVLSSVAGKYNLVMVYDEAGDKWLDYNPSKPPFLNTLHELDETRPFHIDMTEAATLGVNIV